MKAVYAFLFFCMCFLCGSVNAQSNADSCEIFRTGKFEMDSEIGRIKIDRNRRHQIERFEIGGKKYKAKYSITWNDECNYTLIFMRSTLPEYNDAEPQPLRVRITSVDGNSYNYICKKDGSDIVMEGKIVKP